MEQEYRYLIEEKDRFGNVRTYYRKKPGPRIRIYAARGAEDFDAEYQRAVAGVTKPAPKPIATTAPKDPGRDPLSLRDLVVRYYASVEFKALDPRTQYVRRLILDKLCLSGGEPGKLPYGERPFALMEPRHVRAIRNTRADKPEAANGIIKALRCVFSWAIEEDVPGTRFNPAKDVRYLKGRVGGFHSWTIDEVRAYEDRHPIGTPARLALAILLYTSQRRADVIQLGPQHVRDGNLDFTQHKGRNKKPVVLSIPILPELWEAIDATVTGTKSFLVNAQGRPFTHGSFGNRFRAWCDQAGLKGCSAHGLRKASAARLAELGCSPHEIMAITGHTTLKEVTRYTEAARRRVLATSAMDKAGMTSGPHRAALPENRAAKTLNVLEFGAQGQGIRAKQ